MIVSVNAYGKPVVFTVKNNTDSQLVELQISSNNHSWSAFSEADVNAGQTAAFEWNPTPQSSCTQFIRGRFSILGWSAPVKIDFCENSAVKVIFE